MRFAALALCLLAAHALAQTKLDLGHQANNADFAQYSLPTRPQRTLGSLPATCVPGETFFVAPNFYGCGATNTPVAFSVSGGTYISFTQSTSDMGEPCSIGTAHANTAADTFWVCNNGTRSRVLTDGDSDIVRTGANNTWTTGSQSFAAATAFIVRIGAGAAPTASGSVAYDSTANLYRGGVNGSMKTFAFLDSNITGNAATASAFAADPANCSAGTLPRGVDAAGVCQGAAAVNLASEVTGLLPVANGGLGISTVTDDGVHVGNGTGFTYVILPSCSNTTTSKLLYNISTNAFSCGTDQGGAPGGSDTQLEYNNSGAFAGTAGLTWSSVLARLRLANTPPASDATEAALLMGSPMTGGSTAGTVIGGSQSTGYVGDFLNFQVNGVTAFKVSYTGGISTGNGTDTGYIEGLAGTAPGSPGAGFLRLFWNGSSVLQDKDSSGTVRTYVDLASTQTLAAKTLTTPTIASFTSATHTHANAAGGGQLGVAGVSATGTPSSSTYWRGDNTWSTPSGGGGGGVLPKEFLAAKCQAGTAGAGSSLPASLTPNPVCITGTNVLSGELELPDSDGEYSVQDRFKMDTTALATAINLNIKWRAAATSGNVVWQLQGICVADGETIDPALATAQTVIDAAKGTTLQINDAQIATITVATCAAGETYFYRLFRDRTHASDTITGIVKLLSWEFTN